MVTTVLMQSWKSSLLVKVLSGLVLFSVLGSLAYLGHYFVSVSREKRAYKAFAESHDFFEQALANSDANKNSEMWHDVELAFQNGYEKNKGSRLAPYFLAFKAEALLHQGNLDAALGTMDQMLGSLTQDAPLFGLYAIKRSLMRLDSAHDAVRDAGLNELMKLASEQVANPHRDMALYYLGEYYWVHDDQNKARIAWKYLKEMADVGKSPTPSPWFDLVKTRFENLV